LSIAAQNLVTLVANNSRWQALITDDILWELAYAPAIGAGQWTHWKRNEKRISEISDLVRKL
jgi:hypothetical protein